MDKIKILIADDHKIVRVGLHGILEREPDLAVIGEAENGDEVLEFLKSHVVDVILIDIDMGRTNGIDTTRKVKEVYPDIKLLALTMHEEQDSILKMLQAGANGYLLKNVGREELVSAIHAIASGNSYFSSQVSATLLQAITTLKSNPPKPKHDSILTDREVEVLRLIAREYSNAEIAEKLFISVRTVDTHRRNILEKLQVKNTAGMVRYAIEKALI
ncbi:MAG TPA: response regulator transcription factor [Cyclobacteriaceae bacterium]|nr:response regulator transcription factor [Cyclobacteriaceae bacterium]